MITAAVPSTDRTFHRHPTAARRARIWARSALANWSTLDRPLRTGAVDDIVLVVSELVSNSVLHAQGEIHAHLELVHAAVRVEVHDSGPAPAVARPDSGTYGRGLTITNSLADHCGWTRRPGRATAWATVPVAA
ncbi:hypothetical protein RVR_P27 (plasmid) [Actinacidiphila reveromycinica]|uniref:Histidine kinase/HSP90-like ATPase domain-containing protein n=1 Tax=Actinacidiphila reveromycinica TaxID=659352 RepID=A0A7R6QF24_9ACTN|nr:ATP-binding protein [Streptomyces sp. SN-593]BBG20752.1 hypothetical protein RVR_P27 [Streptomyces sp. SN-593]